MAKTAIRIARQDKPGSAGSFSALIAARKPQGAPASAPTSLVAGLLDIDGESDAAGARSRGLKHGATMLDELEDLRRAILLGSVPEARLTALSNELRARAAPADPALASLLADIELRVAVELAKLGQAAAC